MYTAASAIHAAKSQVGYHEGKTGTHWNNIQKYAPAIGFTNGLAWCDTFVNWVFVIAGIRIPSGAKSAGCAVSVNAYKKNGRFTQYPGIGFQVFYGSGGGAHTGIVCDYDATYIYTVEGNTNVNGSAEGDGVYDKKRVRRDAYVYGYGIPYYVGTCKSADPFWNGKELSH